MAGDDADHSRVRVAVRVRPTNRADKGVGEACVQVDGNKVTIDNGQRTSNFTYDFVFTGDQKEVYSSIGESMLQDAFSGYNTCIFAYGQTGSGKTYSLLGNQNDPNDEKNQGLLPRITRELFDLCEELQAEDPTLSVKIQVSFMEVYNEKVHDLLQFEGTNQRPEIKNLSELKIKQKKKNKGFYVEDLSTHTVMGWSRVAKLISNGTDMRARAETDMNELSSRSHSVFTIYINQTHEPPNPSVPDKKSKINIVDLAGSERQSKTGIENDAKAVKEAEKINYSLLVLGRCLNACSDPKQKGHLPVRDSALTKILSEIFGGNTKTIMFATVSPSVVNHTESLSTLQYAYNAKKIKHKAKVNSVAKALEIKELQEQVRRLGQDLLEELEKSALQKETLDAEIKALSDEKSLLGEALGEMKIENENLRKALEQLQAENAALRAGRGIAADAAVTMGSPTLMSSASNSSMVLGGAHDPNGINLQSPTQLGGTYANAHNLPMPMMTDDESGGMTARRPPIEEDDDEDEELKKQKLQEIQDILMKKLPLLNPSLQNHMGGSIPNTARGPGDDSVPNSMPNTARGAPGVLNGVAASNEIRSYIGHASAVYSCSFSPSGDRMLSASRDRTLKIWNVKSGNEILTLKGHHGFVLSCAFHPNGNDVVSASDDKTLKVWNANSGKKTLTLKGHNDKVYCCTYSSSGTEIASSSCDKTIKIWNSESGKKLATLRGHTSAVFCVAFANGKDSGLLVSASDDKTLRLWNWKAGEEKMTFQGHTGTVWSCCFSPADNRILSASMDGTVKLWDVETSFSVRTFRGHSAPVHHAIFAKNGEKIISASRDRTLKIWDTETGKVLSTLIGHANTVYHCCVHNNLILSCSSDDILKVWNLKV